MLTADQSACRVAVPGAITCSKLEKKLSQIADRGQLEYSTALASLLTVTLIIKFDLEQGYDLDFRSSASYGHEPYACKKITSRSGGSKVRVKADERTRPI